jgi:uncharacterized protein YxjI
MALCIEQRPFSWRERYDITDDNGSLVYVAVTEPFAFGHQIHIYDPKGEEVATVEQRLFSLFRQFDIYLHGEKKGTIYQRLSFFHSSFDIDYLDASFVGSLFDFNYQVLIHGEVVATMSRRFLPLMNIYYLETKNPEDELSMLALSLAVDAAEHDEGNSHK